jgi:hypothetical protein
MSVLSLHCLGVIVVKVNIRRTCWMIGTEQYVDDSANHVSPNYFSGLFSYWIQKSRTFSTNLSSFG